MAKRKTATDLVGESVKPKTIKWTETLTAADISYLKEVVAEMKRTPGAAPYVVAPKLKVALGLIVSVGTIARTLKEMIANG